MNQVTCSSSRTRKTSTGPIEMCSVRVGDMLFGMQGNLCGPEFPFRRRTDRFDVIFLRNVMLYLSQETRRALLAGIHRLLPSDGLLFLGSAEQPADPSLWTSIIEGGTCYFRPRLAH
jgi:chemotaxis methyl-accepting protein methylase